MVNLRFRYPQKLGRLLSHREFALLTLAVAGLLCYPGLATASPQPRLREIVSKLRSATPPANQSIETRVPPSVANDLADLKHALRDLIVASASVPGATETNPEVLTSRVIARIEDDGVPVGDGGGFGVISGIDFRRPKEFSSWLIATTRLAIPYGVDTSLYLFELRGGAWKHALTLESNGYEEISGAQGWLTYHVSTAQAGKKPYLVTAEITPWPTSVWQTLRLKVLRIGEEVDRPVILATRSLSYCLDDTYYVSTEADRFSLIYQAEPADRELAGWRGVHYIEYSVGDTKAQVERETVVDPYNLIRKWAAQEWPVASKSVNAANSEIVRAWHQRFRSARWACGLGGTYLSKRTVGDRDELVSISECIQGANTTPAAYVILVAGSGGFRIDSLSTSKPASPEGNGYTIYNAGGPGITDPIPVSQPPVLLPADILADLGTEAHLLLSIVINEDGTVGTVNIRDWPASHSEVVMPTIRAVRRWRYKPGLKDGRPVKVSLPTSVAFEN